MTKDAIQKIYARLDEIEARLANIERGADTPAVQVPPSVATHQKKLSLKEFIISKKPTDDVKKTLAIGYFLEKVEGLSSFNITDLEAAYERAKEKKPTNMNDKVNMNIRNGHVEETSEKKDSRKAWYLTNSGERFVENEFNDKK